MILGLCILAAVALVTGMMAIPVRSPAPGAVARGRARRRRRWQRDSVPLSRGAGRPAREPRVVVRRRWVRRLGVEQTVIRLERDPRHPAPPTAGPGPVPADADDLDLSGFDRRPPILGPARLSELRPQVAEWRW